MTDAEFLIDYFNEHVFYELLMLRYSKQCLEETKDQYLWNAMFAAFNVSARNLYDFLNNNGNRGTDVNVDDYKLFRRDTHRDSTSDVTGTLGLLHAQCLHMGKKRTKESDKKINRVRIETVSDWVQSNMDNLLKTFNDDFGSKLRPEWADVLSQKRIVSVPGPTGPTACSVTSVMTTGPTGMGQPIQFEVTPKK
jgi:hypothetical protein